MSTETDTDALVPVAWVDGCDLLNMGKGLEPTISGHPVSEHDVPLYGPDIIERLTRERDEAVARERERCKSSALEIVLWHRNDYNGSVIDPLVAALRRQL